MILKPTVVAGAVIVCGGLAAHAQQTPTAETRPEVTRAQTHRWMTELSNWGRWGKDDQLGTLNLITPEKRQQAVALAKRGIVVSLERPVAITPMPEATKRDATPATRASGTSVLPWMKARGVSITSAIRSIPEGPRANHVVALVAMGLHLMDGPRLDELAETAARLNQLGVPDGHRAAKRPRQLRRAGQSPRHVLSAGIGFRRASDLSLAGSASSRAAAEWRSPYLAPRRRCPLRCSLLSLRGQSARQG